MPPPAPAGRTQYTGHLAREQTRAPLRPQRQLTAASGKNDPRLTIDRSFVNNKGDTHHDYNGQLHFLSFVNNTNKKIIQTNKQTGKARFPLVIDIQVICRRKKRPSIAFWVAYLANDSDKHLTINRLNYKDTYILCAVHRWYSFRIPGPC